MVCYNTQFYYKRESFTSPHWLPVLLQPQGGPTPNKDMLSTYMTWQHNSASIISPTSFLFTPISILGKGLFRKGGQRKARFPSEAETKAASSIQMLLPGDQASVTLGNLDYTDTPWEYHILRSSKISPEVPRRHKGRKRPLSKRTRVRRWWLTSEHMVLIATGWAPSSTPAYSESVLQQDPGWLEYALNLSTWGRSRV